MILTVSGSTRTNSENQRLLDAIIRQFEVYNFVKARSLKDLPLFNADDDHFPYPSSVIEWKKEVSKAEGVVFCTPAYLNNVPAALKNALEWLTTSGELMHKRVIALTYTPKYPRGEKAMQSLIWSLQALEAQVVVQCPLYQTELTISADGRLKGDESIGILKECLGMLYDI